MRAILVAGLFFGDEGKGSIVDSLVREMNAKLVVRYNGGPQAAHHVVTQDGKEHCFSQFGSGTLAGAHTYLSRFMVIEPLALFREAAHLETLGIYRPCDLLTIHPDAPIITPYHSAMNKLREISRGSNRHGSCGRGIGELAMDIATHREILTAKDIWRDKITITLEIANNIQDKFLNECVSLNFPDNEETESLLEILSSPTITWLKRIWASTDLKLQIREELPYAETVVFEGAQGVLLDEKYGFYPHTTWSNITYENAYSILREATNASYEVTRIGVTRCYATRHGNGPFPTEDPGIVRAINEHNIRGNWQGDFRLGHLDLVLLKYAIEVLGGIDFIALTCLDQAEVFGVATDYYYESPLFSSLVFKKNCSLVEQEMVGRILSKIYVRYQTIGNYDRLCREIVRHLQVPIGIISRGATAKDKEYLEIVVDAKA
jgi:adenylosuccinate synthase